MTRLPSRTIVLVVVGLLLMSGLGTAASTPPEPPYRIYGTVSDQNGNAVNSATVEVVYNGSIVETVSTASSGFYDVKVADPDDTAASETLTVRVAEKSASQTVTRKQGTSTKIDFQITVRTGGGGGGGGSRDGGSDTTPVPKSDRIVEAIQTERGGTALLGPVKANEPIGIDMSNTTQPLGVNVSQVTVEFTRDATNVSVSVDVSDVPLEGAPQLDIEGTNSRQAVGYVRVSISGIDEEQDTSEGSFEFTVSQSRLNKLGLAPEEVALYRYHDGEWHMLPTRYLSDERYTATTPGFSVFAIGSRGGSQQTPQLTQTTTPVSTPDSTPVSTTTLVEQTNIVTEESTSEPTETGQSTPVFGVVVTVIALLAAALLAVHRN